MNEEDETKTVSVTPEKLYDRVLQFLKSIDASIENEDRPQSIVAKHGERIAWDIRDTEKVITVKIEEEGEGSRIKFGVRICTTDKVLSWFAVALFAGTTLLFFCSAPLVGAIVGVIALLILLLAIDISFFEERKIATDLWFSFSSAFMNTKIMEIEEIEETKRESATLLQDLQYLSSKILDKFRTAEFVVDVPRQKNDRLPTRLESLLKSQNLGYRIISSRINRIVAQKGRKYKKEQMMRMWLKKRERTSYLHLNMRHVLTVTIHGSKLTFTYRFPDDLIDKKHLKDIQRSIDDIMSALVLQYSQVDFSEVIEEIETHKDYHVMASGLESFVLFSSILLCIPLVFESISSIFRLLTPNLEPDFAFTFNLSVWQFHITFSMALFLLYLFTVYQVSERFLGVLKKTDKMVESYPSYIRSFLRRKFLKKAGFTIGPMLSTKATLCIVLAFILIFSLLPVQRDLFMLLSPILFFVGFIGLGSLMFHFHFSAKLEGKTYFTAYILDNFPPSAWVMVLFNVYILSIRWDLLGDINCKEVIYGFLYASFLIAWMILIVLLTQDSLNEWRSQKSTLAIQKLLSIIIGLVVANFIGIPVPLLDTSNTFGRYFLIINQIMIGAQFLLLKVIPWILLMLAFLIGVGVYFYEKPKLSIRKNLAEWVLKAARSRIRKIVISSSLIILGLLIFPLSYLGESISKFFNLPLEVFFFIAAVLLPLYLFLIIRNYRFARNSLHLLKKFNTTESS